MIIWFQVCLFVALCAAVRAAYVNYPNYGSYSGYRAYPAYVSYGYPSGYALTNYKGGYETYNVSNNKIILLFSIHIIWNSITYQNWLYFIKILFIKA